MGWRELESSLLLNDWLSSILETSTHPRGELRRGGSHGARVRASSCLVSLSLTDSCGRTSLELCLLCSCCGPDLAKVGSSGQGRYTLTAGEIQPRVTN